MCVPGGGAHRHGLVASDPVRPGAERSSLGLDRTDAELGLDGTNLWIYPERDRNEAFARFVASPDAHIPLVYASFPSSKDPSFAERYPGKATVELVTLASMKWLEPWRDGRWKKRGAEYADWKAKMSERLLDE